MNRTSHGLTARQVVLKDENQQEFDDLHAGFMQEYVPKTTTQEELVQEAVASAWRLRRADRLETKYFDEGTGDLDTLRRYRTSIERSFHKAIDQLRKLKADEKKQQPTAKKEDLRQAAISQAFELLMGAPLPGDGGFVSQDDQEEPNEEENIEQFEDEVILEEAS